MLAANINPNQPGVSATNRERSLAALHNLSGITKKNKDYVQTISKEEKVADVSWLEAR